MQELAQVKRLRVTFLSGDVHCAAVGLLKTLAKPKEEPISPGQDYRYMLNLVTSAIVNTPCVISEFKFRLTLIVSIQTA